MLLNRVRIFLIILGGVILLPLIIFRLLPYKELKEFSTSEYSIEIFDVNDELLYTTPLENGLKRIKVNSKDLSKDILKPVLESEDKYFFLHYGFNGFSIFRTIYNNIKEDRVISGASTISMQVARIITPRNKSYKSKILEIIDAVKLESRLTKHEILSIYLSHVPFGMNIEGYGAASRRFFDKSIYELTENEIAVLSVIPRNPRFYNPYKNRENIKISLDKVYSRDFNKELSKLKNTESNSHNPIKAPHFVNYIIKGLTDKDYENGEAIYTTLDLNINVLVQELLNYYLDQLTHNRVSNGAIILVKDNKIVSYIGSRDFYDSENQGQIDGVQILRQPGSTLKPFLYELALEMGFTAASILPDIPTTFGAKEVYKPENYSQTYNGPVDIRTALASSLNIPAVYILERIGVKNFVKRLKELGFNSLNGQEESLGLGLAVGNAEVSLFELVRAFSTFKNAGYYSDITGIVNKKMNSFAVMDESNTGIILDILSDNKSRVLGFGRNSTLKTDYPAIFKTGTSNQFNNIWALGATKDYTCGVWMGNFTGETVMGTPGSSIPALIAEKILDNISEKEEFNTVSNVVQMEICTLSGSKPNDSCNTTRLELFSNDMELDICSYHKSDGSIEVPPEYSSWLDAYRYDNYSINAGSGLDIVSPQDGSIYYYSPEIPSYSQGIELNIMGQGSIIVKIDNRIIVDDQLPLSKVVFIDQGEWEVEFNNDGIIERRLIKIY